VPGQQDAIDSLLADVDSGATLNASALLRRYADAHVLVSAFKAVSVHKEGGCVCSVHCASRLRSHQVLRALPVPLLPPAFDAISLGARFGDNGDAIGGDAVASLADALRCVMCHYERVWVSA
jgi:hypothetical protein